MARNSKLQHLKEFVKHFLSWCFLGCVMGILGGLIGAEDDPYGNGMLVYKKEY